LLKVCPISFPLLRNVGSRALQLAATPLSKVFNYGPFRESVGVGINQIPSEFVYSAIFFFTPGKTSISRPSSRQRPDYVPSKFYSSSQVLFIADGCRNDAFIKPDTLDSSTT